MNFNANACDPVFVVGFYRSGTSLLHALLNQHPDIALMYECDVLKLWPLVRSKSVHRNWLGRLEYWNRSQTRHRLEQMPATPVQNRAEAAMWLYRAFAAKKGARVLGEKSPYYHDCLPKLAADFPRSRIIVLWRSPSDILRSLQRAADSERFFAAKNWPRRVEIGAKRMMVDCAALRARGHAIHEIHYSSLIADQMAAMQRICAFLEIPYDQRMTSLEGADVSMLPAGEHHRNVRGQTILRDRPSGNDAVGGTCFPADEKFAGSCERATTARGPVFTPADRLAAARFAGSDAALRTLYAYCPLRLLNLWRKWRCRSFAARRQNQHAVLPAHGAHVAGTG
jgi:hypothetical protein